MENFRHELKYQMGTADYLAMRQKLRAVMKADSHAGKDGRYTIRSIYFDNIFDQALRDKINGESRREKFRIRYYNDDFSYITLEKKMKYNNLSKKIMVEISEEECRQILTGPSEQMLLHPEETVRELYCKMKNQLLRPRVLVSYTREPFVYEAGNVRITFDSDIRTSLFHRKFLETTVNDISAVERPEERILEVKYDSYLPEVIAEILQSGSFYRQAFSKYAACRRFG